MNSEILAMMPGSFQALARFAQKVTEKEDATSAATADAARSSHYVLQPPDR